MTVETIPLHQTFRTAKVRSLSMGSTKRASNDRTHHNGSLSDCLGESPFQLGVIPTLLIQDPDSMALASTNLQAKSRRWALEVASEFSDSDQAAPKTFLGAEEGRNS